MSKNKSPFTLTGVDLDLADDRAYQDYMTRDGFRDGRVWTLFLAPERVDRTLELIRNTKSSLEQQLGFATRTQEGGDPDWRKRTVNLLRIVETYLAEVRSEVKRLDAEERNESAEGQLEQWKRVAGLLVDLLVDNPALDFITLPSGVMTAAEWAERRAEKAASARVRADLRVAA